MTCLDALMPQLASVDGAVVTVVDNGSTDGSIAEVTTRFPNVRFIPLPENRGFTGGIAAGLVRSVARNVIFLNNDAIPERDWLAELVKSIDDAPPDVISSGGKIIDTTGQLIDFIGGVMTFDGHAFQNGFRFPLGSREEPADGAEIFFACGGNMISRREPLLDLGGFDDDYFAYLEDVDFGWRSWVSGFRHIFASRAVVRHHSSATSNRLGNFERGVLFERNALQTAMKNYDDELLREISGSIFFTYLHRLHHYATTRNTNVTELTRTPFGTAATVPPPHSRSLKHRIRRRIAGREGLATIDDPLTAMQFRAFDWIVKNSDRIAAKRAVVQRRRKRTDREVFDRFPLHFVPTYPGDDELLRNPLFRILRPAVSSAERELGDIIRT
ncbi:MAG: hypothetical protein QOI24_2071 [Acidobacteriota bacterium]|nr:hypothetical protein [Acidobacteriota bacterium]